jgi:hypothetical protein
MDPVTGEVGGVLPVGTSEFVRQHMTTDSLREQSRMRTISTRVATLDRSAQSQGPVAAQKFISFPNAAIYAPMLYVPQVIGIRLAALFSEKTYITSTPRAL